MTLSPMAKQSKLDASLAMLGRALDRLPAASPSHTPWPDPVIEDKPFDEDAVKAGKLS